ncbi:hypothetical protein ACUN0C_19850 [Faunimonas sp. B44]
MTAEEAAALLELIRSDGEDVPEIDPAALIQAYLAAIGAAGQDRLL